jgi:hypothetical protein
MGCSNSRPADPSIREGVDLKDVNLGGTTPLSQRTSQRRNSATLGSELPELQSKLEKLDEERHRVQEELKRIQSTAALEQDAELPEGSSANGEKPRVRFSKFDGDMALQQPAVYGDRQPPGVSRRTSSANTIARLSSYRAASSSGEYSDRREDKLSAGRDLKALTEMVNRGRRRTRYTHRSSAGEPHVSTGETKVHYLPRGGVHVTTKYGAVQFGMPPETIKDAMSLGLQVRPAASALSRRTLIAAACPAAVRTRRVLSSPAARPPPRPAPASCVRCARWRPRPLCVPLRLCGEPARRAGLLPPRAAHAPRARAPAGARHLCRAQGSVQPQVWHQHR